MKPIIIIIKHPPTTTKSRLQYIAVMHTLAGECIVAPHGNGNSIRRCNGGLRRVVVGVQLACVDLQRIRFVCIVGAVVVTGQHKNGVWDR